MQHLGQDHSFSNSVGLDFKTKKFSWARHFQLQVMTNFKLTQINVITSKISLYTVSLLNFVTSDTVTSLNAETVQLRL